MAVMSKNLKQLSSTDEAVVVTGKNSGILGGYQITELKAQ